MCQALRQVLGAKWEWSRGDKPSGPPQFATPRKGPARHQKAPSQDTGRRKIGLPKYPAASRTRDPYHPGLLPGLALTLRRSCSGPLTPWDPGPQFPHPAIAPLQGPTCPGDTNALDNQQIRPFRLFESQFPLRVTHTPVTAKRSGRTN